MADPLAAEPSPYSTDEAPTTLAGPRFEPCVELPPPPEPPTPGDGSDEGLIATGFLAAARISSNEEDKWLQRSDVTVDVVNAVGSAFLGLTLHCAQCHDHAYDPISQADFYRMRAFFDDTILTRRDQPLGPYIQRTSAEVPASAVTVATVASKRPGGRGRVRTAAGRWSFGATPDTETTTSVPGSRPVTATTWYGPMVRRASVPIRVTSSSPEPVSAWTTTSWVPTVVTSAWRTLTRAASGAVMEPSFVRKLDDAA